MRVRVRVFSVGFGPGLDSMSPARSRPERRGRWIQFAQCSPRLWHTNHEQAVSVWCNWDSSTRLSSNYLDVSLALTSLITSTKKTNLSTKDELISGSPNINSIYLVHSLLLMHMHQQQTHAMLPGSNKFM